MKQSCWCQTNSSTLEALTVDKFLAAHRPLSFPLSETRFSFGPVGRLDAQSGRCRLEAVVSCAEWFDWKCLKCCWAGSDSFRMTMKQSCWCQKNSSTLEALTVDKFLAAHSPTIISCFRDAFFVWPCWTARCSEWKMSIGSCCFLCWMVWLKMLEVLLSRVWLVPHDNETVLLMSEEFINIRGPYCWSISCRAFTHYHFLFPRRVFRLALLDG